MRLPALALAVLVLATARADADARPGACRPVVPNDGEPSWSPDGRQLAFVRRGGGCSRDTAVHVLSLVDARLRRLATGGGEHPPVWSPDGTRLAFPSGGRLTVVSVRGRGLDQLALGGEAPAWSPDGRRIAFTFGSGLRVVGVDGSDERLLASALESGSGPGWSPGGNELVYAADGDIHVVDVGSGAGRVVAGHPAWDAEPVWAGASGRILFVSARSGSAQLWSVTREGRVRQETYGPDRTRRPASSRSGSRVAFVRLGAAAPGVHYRPPDARRHVRVSANREIARALAFSPDGRYLAWAARGRCSRFGIHVYGPLGAAGTERRLTNRCDFRGTPRADVIRGTPWRDVVDAGAGNDLLLVRDGHRDSVRCGTGRDRVVADRKDALARDCELVERR